MIDDSLHCPALNIRKEILNGTYICIPRLLFSFQGNKAWGMGATSTLIMMAKFILDCFTGYIWAKGDNLKAGKGPF